MEINKSCFFIKEIGLLVFVFSAKLVRRRRNEAFSQQITYTNLCFSVACVLFSVEFDSTIYFFICILFILSPYIPSKLFLIFHFRYKPIRTEIIVCSIEWQRWQSCIYVRSRLHSYVRKRKRCCQMSLAVVVVASIFHESSAE